MRTRFSLLFPWVFAAAAVASRAEGQDDRPAPDAKPRASYKVSGTVTDAGRMPLGLVEIAALDSAGQPRKRTTTDDRGHFDLGRFAHGPLALTARRLGYEQRTMQIEVNEDGRSASLEIVLLIMAGTLEDVNVTAPPPPTKLQGFHERSRQARTFGRFLTEDHIRRMNPRSASELFRNVPGVTLGSDQSGGNVIRIRGCQPMVWLDGQRIPGAELDELIEPSSIAAIEFYQSSAGIPAQYLERGNRLCGVILVWTKSGE